MTTVAIILYLLCALATASPQLRKRDVCTVESRNDPLADDVPAINDALKKCGDSGRIVLPVNHTFNIRSPLELSSCLRCDFQINGLVHISPDWDYWEKQSAVFKVSNATATIIGSDGDTGIIDANGFGWNGDTALFGKIPPLFSIVDESYQVYVRNLKIKGVPGTAFHIGSNTSATRFYGIDIQGAPNIGYLIEQARHVYLWNTTTRAASSCVAVKPNSTNIQVEESICVVARTLEPTSSATMPQTSSGTALDWIRNIFVKNVRAIGTMDIISFLVNQTGSEPHAIEITNATFTDITITRLKSI